MAKHFKRGTPEDDNLKAQQAFIRHLWEEEVASGNVDSDLLGGEMFDLMNGEVELMLPDGRDFRLYTVTDGTDFRVVIDDYHPDEDAEVTVDEYDVITQPDHPHIKAMEDEGESFP